MDMDLLASAHVSPTRSSRLILSCTADMPAHGTSSKVKRNYSDANLYEPLEGLNPPSAALSSTSAVLVPPSASSGQDRTVKEAPAKKSKTCSTSTLATNPKEEFLFVADTCQGPVGPLV